MTSQQVQGPVPSVAVDVNQRAIETYETYRDAARQIHDSLTVAVDVNSYARAMGRYEEAVRLAGEVQPSIGELKGRCG